MGKKKSTQPADQPSTPDMKEHGPVENQIPKSEFIEKKVGKPHVFKGFGRAALFAVPAILIVATLLAGTDLLLEGRLMPGAKFGNTSLGFEYLADVEKKLTPEIEKYLNTPFHVTVADFVTPTGVKVAGSEVQITPRELGINFQLAQTLAALPAYDLRKDNLITLALAIVTSHSVDPLITYDQDTAAALIEQKLDLKKFSAVDAKIIFDGTHAPTISPEANGLMLDQTELQNTLVRSAKTLTPTAVTLRLIEEKPAVTTAQLEPRKKFMVDALKKPITLAYEGQKWKFEPAKHLDAMEFSVSRFVTIKNLGIKLPIELQNALPESNDNIEYTQEANMVIDHEKVKDFFEKEIVAKIDHPTSDVKIYTDEKKNIVIEGKGENGVQVSREELYSGINLALNNNIQKLDIPVIEQKANVTVSEDLQSQGIKNLIATGHTAFAGSHPGRVKNIEVGISRYNGLFVKQGETFSFNDHLGPVDGEHGFVKELVITGQGTVPDYGGGLCQVSSTMYRAALFAGFPIVERAGHSYAVSYYAQVLGYGLDGTIYPGVHDVKFINNSPSNIVMQAYIEGDQAYYKFYGTDDGRKVWLEGPIQDNYRSPGPAKIIETSTLPPGARKQVEINHTGFDVTWYRYMTKDNQTTKEKIFTRYNAIPAKIMVGHGAAPDPAITPSL